MSWLERLLNWLRLERHDIGRKGLDRYLTRWYLWGSRFKPGRKVVVHCFHNGDPEPYCHDHPFPFWSLILWSGYFEHDPTGKRWYGPGSLLRRPATWQHRVELPPGRRCWTLLLFGLVTRSWGFWTPCGFLPWREHQARQDAGIPICDEEE